MGVLTVAHLLSLIECYFGREYFTEISSILLTED